jgi:hypothetical protein
MLLTEEEDEGVPVAPRWLPLLRCCAVRGEGRIGVDIFVIVVAITA